MYSENGSYIPADVASAVNGEVEDYAKGAKEVENARRWLEVNSDAPSLFKHMLRRESEARKRATATRIGSMVRAALAEIDKQAKEQAGLPW